MASGQGELPHLETFCTAAELLSFTATAATLGLTQAAVSQRIRTLERDLGQQLFDRQGARVQLSVAGQRLYEYAQRILALHREARAALGQPPPELEGELHLAASTVPGEYLLPAILQEFHRRYPRVHVVATVADSHDVLQALAEERVSLALVGRPGPAAWAESRPIARDELVLVVPPGHRWAKRKKVSLAELHDEPLVLREPGSGSRGCLEETLQRRGQSLADFHIALELGSNEAIKEALGRGAGAAFLSTLAIQHDLASGRLLALATPDLSVARDLYVVTHRGRHLPPPARAFLEVLPQSLERR